MKDDELIITLTGIIQNANTIPFNDHLTKDKVQKRLKMLVRKRFGDNSYYLYDVINNDFSDYSLILGATEDKYRNAWEAGKKKLVNLIETMIEEIKTFPIVSGDTQSKSEVDKSYQKIFIVHGHDNEMVQTVARFVSKLGFEPIILREQPNQGRTIIEKFEDFSDVDFALVLLSPDDEGKSIEEEILHKRPRQNVVFELGFFIGRLGRQNVVVLHREVDDFEMLSDFQGVLFESYREGWEFRVAKEIKAAGFEVDLNRLAK